MVAKSRKMLALEESGAEVAQIEADLKAARALRAKRLVAAYKEGWAWNKLAESGHMSLFTVAATLKREGVSVDSKHRQEMTEKVSRQVEAERRQSNGESA